MALWPNYGCTEADFCGNHKELGHISTKWVLPEVSTVTHEPNIVHKWILSGSLYFLHFLVQVPVKALHLEISAI